jgi:hypothetical protein
MNEWVKKVILMKKSSKFAKIEAEGLDLTEDLKDDSTDIIVDSNKRDYKYKMELELVKSTRDNFMVWKDFEY